MGTELTIQETITTKIRKHFLELFPEDKFKELVNKEIKEFTERKSGYSGSKPSIMEQMIQHEIKNQLENKFKEKIKTELYKVCPWNDIKSDEVLKKYCEMVAPDILNGIALSVAQQAIEQFHNNLQYQ